jgi:crotonobetainyl-CoA:carnitine CoA-transferase CaiB-like acyl-CoA transferase
MKNLILSAVLLISTSAMAQERIINFPIPCTDVLTLAEVVDKHEEEAAMTMTTSREIEGRIIISPTVLFVNFKTKSWTLAERITKDTYCIIAVGDDLKPYQK